MLPVPIPSYIEEGAFSRAHLIPKLVVSFRRRNQGHVAKALLND